mmetsp:Transcript_21696/g.38342  ORF Transcript_21696/g.38342 Transcript_21696/m.38342 type:complete len:244 (-) Transcript_21696:430-1161(-)
MPGLGCEVHGSDALCGGCPGVCPCLQQRLGHCCMPTMRRIMQCGETPETDRSRFGTCSQQLPNDSCVAAPSSTVQGCGTAPAVSSRVGTRTGCEEGARYLSVPSPGCVVQRREAARASRHGWCSSLQQSANHGRTASLVLSCKVQGCEPIVATSPRLSTTCKQERHEVDVTLLGCCMECSGATSPSATTDSGCPRASSRLQQQLSNLRPTRCDSCLASEMEWSDSIPVPATWWQASREENLRQ